MSTALEDGLHFAPAQNSEGYLLEPATPQELIAFEQAKEEAENEEE